jgi:hypothetical protein
MLEVCDARYASMRDAARQHGELERLRASLLTLSIDMSSIERDIRAYNAYGCSVTTHSSSSKIRLISLLNMPNTAAGHVSRST